MKEFQGFVVKEFYHIFRDKRTLLILFGMPVALMLIFGFVITNEIKNARIAVLDLSKDEITFKLINKLTSSGYFFLYQNIDRMEDVEQVMRKGTVKEVIIFEPEFAQKLHRYNKASIQIIADATDANYANMLVNYTSGIVQTYNAEMSKTANQPMQIIPEVRMTYNPELKGVFMFVPGIMSLILILISALMTSVTLVREKEFGTMEVLLVSHLKPFQIIIGKVLPYVLLAFIDGIIIILMSIFVFELPVQGSMVLLLAETLLFILLSLSLGILISTKAKTQQEAMFFSMIVLMLPTLLLSGFIYPIENMPNWLQVICNIMPAKYFIEILKGIMVKGVGLEFIWKQTLILLGMTIFLLTISIRKFKERME
jgi:ABC-2 type transport system permease protein